MKGIPHQPPPYGDAVDLSEEVPTWREVVFLEVASKPRTAVVLNVGAPVAGPVDQPEES